MTSHTREGKGLRVLDLFSGIGGFSLGLERAGMRTVAFCEIDPFCRRVLAKHWPEVPCHDDVTTREFQEGEADVICGGFPCQDVSRAGKRAGLAGARSGLYRELVRALRMVRPRHGIVENVAALLGDGMGTVLGDMAESGLDAEWDCVPARAVGAPHERDRVWIVTHANNERCREARELQHRSIQVPTRGASPRIADAPRIGCGQGRTRRPPDSFARVRDETRGHAADAASARLEGWPLSETARRPLSKSPRRYFEPWPHAWPDEPPLSGVDDGISDWVDRTKSTGNAVLPQIPELIGLALSQSLDAGEEG
jgi:DNA (cytosine-5)-methyltransferase 1